MKDSRRKFIKQSAIVTAAFPMLPTAIFNSSLDAREDNLNVSIFSKHLQFLDYKQTGQIASELGFDGVDLTVRPKGHVLPENAAKQLPQAIRDIQDGGAACKMITTSIESVNNPLDVAIIETAARSGVEFYRCHWFRYQADVSLKATIEKYQKQIHDLAILNKSHNIIGCYQNHAGRHIGASYWEIEKLLETADSDYFGSQYDIRHAIADSSFSWENGLRLLNQRIKVIPLKDFKWGKVDGKWKAINVPIGEGMVDFSKYFKLLKSYGLNPPVSLHLEYPLGGAEKGKSIISVDKKVVFDAMQKDLQAVRKIWKNA